MRVLKRTYVALRVEFDEEFFALEAEFTYFRPGERVDLDDVLEHKHTHVRDGEVQTHPLVVLKNTNMVTKQDVGVGGGCGWEHEHTHVRDRQVQTYPLVVLKNKHKYGY